MSNLLNNQYLLTAGSTTAANARITGSVPYYTYIVEARRNFRTSITYRF